MDPLEFGTSLQAVTLEGRSANSFPALVGANNALKGQSKSLYAIRTIWQKTDLLSIVIFKKTKRHLTAVHAFYLAKVDTQIGAFELCIMKSGLGPLGVKSRMVDDKDTVEGFDGCEVVHLSKGLGLGFDFEHGLLLKVVRLEVGDREGVCCDGGGCCLWHVVLCGVLLKEVCNCVESGKEFWLLRYGMVRYGMVRW